MDLKNRLELYQRVTPLAGLGIFERDFANGTIYWNSIIRDILEVNEDFQPSIEESLNFYKNPEAISEIVNRAAESGKAEEGTLELVTAKGTSKWVKISLQVDCRSGVREKLYGTLQDVTSNIKLINMLEEREKRFSLAFSHAPMGMALVSLSGEWLRVNLSLCKSLGYTETEFLKHTFQEFTHPEDLEKDLKLLQQLLEGKIESYSMEKRYFHANGYIIWVILNVSLVRDENDQPLYFVSQIRDITDIKKTSEMIQNQNSRLLNFAHIVSHNLRSHTGNMKTITDLILQEEDETERNSLVKMLSQNTSNLLETLDHLNEVVKVNDGQVKRIPINLKEAVNRVLGILSASIRETKAVVITEIDEEVAVRFDPAYLESVIINLISNCLKYKHPDRPPQIEISASPTKNHIIFKVKDNGLGIDLMRNSNELFGMYNTFHNHPDARGMGLFLVKNQVEAMGGTISVESTPGVGSAFIIDFER